MRTPQPTTEHVEVITIDSDDSDSEEIIPPEKRGSSPGDKIFPPSFWSPKRKIEETSHYSDGDTSFSPPQTPDSQASTVVLDWEGDMLENKSDKEPNKDVVSNVSETNLYSDISECTTIPSLPEEWWYEDVWGEVMTDFVCTCDECVNIVYCAMVGEVPDYLNI
ncbi:uncharacterized protein LOC124169688 [Ischnura elegans]|uniref:uncharacterized protein LOC124169688 n=1 Tax=Ischnura elegans TaxID=197161 RepID=UPI001ED88FCB|nr:uncharacterized protein LOC124169688 [Ischnura elegans]